MGTWPAVVGVAIVGIGTLWLARWALLVVRIDGRSMEPTFRSGTAVLAVRRLPRQTLRRDAIVVCRLPPQIPGPDALLIKRITGIAGDTAGFRVVPPGQVFVCGDGPSSYDSRHFGPIPVGSVIGRVIARLTG